MSWRFLRVRAGGDRDAVLAAMFGAGAGGVQEDGDALVTHLPEDSDLDALTSRIRALSPAAAIETGYAPRVDWSEAWKDGLRAHTVGALTIAPPWLAGEEPGAQTIVIDPGMAFGTGDHATTRGVIALMQPIIRAGDRVADLGAGSAVLSIAAVRLGASWAAAIEMDPDAIGNAEENVARNGMTGRVQVLEGDAEVLLPLVSPVRVVLANIISAVLLELLPAIRDALAPDGAAILSGILSTEREEMLHALARNWSVIEELEGEGWWSVAITPR